MRVAVATVVTPDPQPGVPRRSSEQVTFRAPLAAGPHLVGITFVERSEALDEGIRRDRMRGRGTLPAIAMATIRGPYAATGPGETPSRDPHLRLPARAPPKTKRRAPSRFCARWRAARTADRPSTPTSPT